MIWITICEKIQLGVHHEVQAAERFIGLVDAVNQVQHLQAEIDDEDIEQVHRDRVHAAHVDLLLAQLGQPPCRAASPPAMPETIAEKMNTTGISGDDHHGLALIDPKMNPT